MAEKKTYVVTYSYVPDMAERRIPIRPEHLEHLNKGAKDGILVLAGALADPIDGGVLIVQAENPGEVLAWVAKDPFAREGLLLGVGVREWTVSVRREGVNF
jgi:uncharacterized protein YciI